MSARLATIVLDLTRAWTRLYTFQLPDDMRNARRAEIESDVWEWRHDAEARGHGQPTATQLLVRLICGVPDDLSWRIEHAPIRRGTALGMTAASLSVLFASVWLLASANDAGMPTPPAPPTLHMEAFLTPPPPPPPPPPQLFDRAPPPLPPPRDDGISGSAHQLGRR
jgi:hypothetical protein